MTQTATLELLTNQYYWNIGSTKTLRTIDALDSVIVGNADSQESYTNITTSNVTSELFIGNLNGQIGTLSVNGNMYGNVLIKGDGTDATNMNLELELDDVNSATAGSFGSQTQIPTFNVDKYGRVSQVANVTISTTLNLLDTNGNTGEVDLLNGDLRINGTSRKILSNVVGNTFNLSLSDNLSLVDVSMSGALQVDGAATLESTLFVGGATTLKDTLTVLGNLVVRGNKTFIESLDKVISDPLIVLGNSNQGVYKDLGFEFIKNSNTDDYGYFGWVGLSNEFQFYEEALIVDNDLQSGNLGTVRAEAFKANIVEATTFLGSLEGSALKFKNSLTLDFSGNVLGSVSFFGNETSIDVPLILEEIANNIGTFGNSVSVPTITVDTYGRVTAVSENSISTTLSLLDTNGNIGEVDLLNGDLRINGTSREIVSNVVGNIFNLSLSDNLSLVDVSMSGALQVDGAATLESTLDVVGGSSLHSTLEVDGAATLKSSLDVSGVSSLHSTLEVDGATTLHSSLHVANNVNFTKDLTIQGNLIIYGTETKIETVTLSIEDNKIELNSEGNVVPFGIYANIANQGGDISLLYEPSNKRWEFNRDLHVSGNLTVSDSTTIQSTLDVVGATSLHNVLEVAANITAPQYFIKDSITGNGIELVAPDLSSGSYRLTLPGTYGIEKQLLQTDGTGTLSWVTPSDNIIIKANVIDNVDNTTSTDDEISLTDYTISYNTTMQPSTVMLQHKIPYESSIHANQRIKFKITKTVDGNTSNINYPDVLGPNNATGGTRGIYISNIKDETNKAIGTNVTFNISAQLTANTTAIDTNGNTRTAGVRTGPEYGVGTVMLTEFTN